MTRTLCLAFTMLTITLPLAADQGVPYVSCRDPRIATLLGANCSENYDQMRISRLSPPCSPYFWDASCRPDYGDVPLFHPVMGVEYVGVYWFRMQVIGYTFDRFGDVQFLCETPDRYLFTWPQRAGARLWCFESPDVPGCEGTR